LKNGWKELARLGDQGNLSALLPWAGHAPFALKRLGTGPGRAYPAIGAAVSINPRQGASPRSTTDPGGKQALMGPRATKDAIRSKLSIYP
jgi:hypothetical protein